MQLQPIRRKLVQTFRADPGALSGSVDARKVFCPGNPLWVPDLILEQRPEERVATRRLDVDAAAF